MGGREGITPVSQSRTTLRFPAYYTLTRVLHYVYTPQDYTKRMSQAIRSSMLCMPAHRQPCPSVPPKQQTQTGHARTLLHPHAC